MNNYRNLSLNVFLVFLFYNFSFASNDQNPKVYVPKQAEQSLDALSNHLTKGVSSDLEKANRIYSWITQNFIFEEKYKQRSKDLTLQQVLRRKRGNAEDFSTIFDSLCYRSGVTSKQIIGYTFTENKPIIKVLYQPNHYWNAIYIDSTWYHVDCLWGSSFGKIKRLTFDIEGNTVNYETAGNDEKTKYFCPSPVNFIKSHLPSDPSWQLLKNHVTSKEFIHNDFSKADTLELNSEKLAKYLSLDNSEYLYASSKNAFEFNSKNHKQLAISSLKKGQNLLYDEEFTRGEKDLFFQKKQIYYHQAASSAMSYSSNVSLYSKIEKEALSLWVRHNIDVPCAKRTKYINRFSLSKQDIGKKETQLNNNGQNIKHFEEKVSKKNYIVLRKPRRKVENDPIYFKVSVKQVTEMDSIIDELQFQVAKLRSINNGLKEKRKENILVKKSLNYSQTSYLQQYRLLLAGDVTLQVLGHQSSQLTKIDNSIDVLIKSIKAVEMEIQINEITISEYTSLLKRNLSSKQNLLRSMFIMSNGKEEYKLAYEESVEVLKGIFYNQIEEKNAIQKAKEWEFQAMQDENEELIRQKKIIKDISKIKIGFRKDKIGAISKREESEKKFCEEIIDASYKHMDELKDYRTQNL